MDLSRYFRPDYQAARCRFLGTATAAGAAIESISHPERGPDGLLLATDVAWIGPANAPAVLVLLAGTHGVEGFCGSGAQIAWLDSGAAQALPPGVAVLLVHGVNPHGFAWQRRVDAANVDLNRNWVDFGGPLPDNPGYRALHPVLMPDTWTTGTSAKIAKALADYAAENGEAALRQALTAGQYSHADGIFHGGTEPTWSRMTLTEIYREKLAAAQQVVIIDYHSGLGPRGMAEQLVPVPKGSAAYARAAAAFGAGILSVVDGASSSAKVGGDGLGAAANLLSHAEVTTMAMEYGTRPFDVVLHALIADNWLHARGDPLSPEGQLITVQLRDAFVGDDDVWRAMVVGQSALAIRQALAFLGSPA